MDEYEELEESEFSDEQEALKAIEEQIEEQKNTSEENMGIVEKILKRGEVAMAEEAMELARELANM